MSDRERSARFARGGLAALALLCLASPCALRDARAETTLQPLEVPAGPLQSPETLPADRRIELGSQALLKRGYPQLPILALALTADRPSPEQLERAVELAPDFPAFRIEAARQRRSPGDLLAALHGLLVSAPCASWLAALISGAAAGGLWIAAAVLALLAFARTYSLHAHGLGHHVGRTLQPAAAVGMLAAISLVPAIGLGPVAVLSVLAALATLRLPRRASAACACAVATGCLALGPGLDMWSRLIAGPAADPALWAAWRVERSQPLPGDGALLQRAADEHPQDLVYALSLATYFKRIGDLNGVRAAVERVPPAAPLALQARAYNLTGIVSLARRDFKGAVESFERSRTLEESAAVLYNLSQAYASNMELDRREKLFSAARTLDADLVSRWASRSSPSIHDYLIQEPVPEELVLARLFAQNEGAEAFGDALRTRLLGFAAPSWLWLLLASLVLCASWLQRSDVVRCRRCDRMLCLTCAPAAVVTEICPRCERVLSSRKQVDPRLRQEQADADRRWQRWLRWKRAGVSLLVPGFGSWLGNRPFLAWLRIWLCAFALVLPWTAQQLPAPFEVGRLAHWLPLGLAVLLGAPFAVWAALEARGWFSGRRA